MLSLVHAGRALDLIYESSSVDGKDEDDAIDVEAVVVAVVAVTMSKRDGSG